MSQPDNPANTTKTCFITGASKRLGACTARKFHQQGFNVIIHYNSSAEDADALISELNSIRKDSASGLQTNLTDRVKVAGLGKAVVSRFQRLDVLVNNASSFYPTAIGQCSHQDWDDLIDSNLRAAFFLTQQLAPELINRNGAVVNMVDTHADSPLRDFPLYSIAKAGVKAMTKSMAKELAPRVRVNGVSPGAILWPPSLEDCADPAVLEGRKKILEKIPLRSLGKAQHIAESVFFLASNARYMTGQIVRVDGGRHLA